MIPKEVISEVLAKADIVQVISNYVNVIKKGNSFVAVCPFHNDTNPSMQISPTKQIFRCFACGTGGNAFGFVQKYEKISFIESVKKVASLVNFTSPLLEEKTREVDVDTKNVLKALNDATSFYHYVLSTSAGEKGKNYLLQRNITHEMIDYFSLGFAPENGELTIKQLRNKSNSVESLEKAGILLHNKGGFTDRFKNRLIFPIHNQFGEVVGYSARRVIDSDEAKYVNSPTTELFNKSNVLYNYQNAKNEAKTAGYCYVVEGFMDVFSLYRVGIRSAVAIMGTAFTSVHAKMLKKLGVEIRLCLDGDGPGQKAMANIVSILDKALINYKIVDYQGDKRDPDEIFNQDGGEALLKRVNTLIKKNEFIIKYYLSEFNVKSIDGKKDFITALSKNVSFNDQIELEAFIKEVSSLTSISPSALKSRFSFDQGEVNIPLQSVKKKKDNREIKIQKTLIHYLLTDKRTRSVINKSNINPFINETYMLLSNYIEEVELDNENFVPNDIVLLIQQMNGSQELINTLLEISEDTNYPSYDDEVINEILTCMNDILKKNHHKQIYDQASLELDELEKAKILDKRKGVK